MSIIYTVGSRRCKTGIVFDVERNGARVTGASNQGRAQNEAVKLAQAEDAYISWGGRTVRALNIPSRALS